MKPREWVADVLLALALALLALASLPEQPIYGRALALAVTLPLAFRRVRPVAVICVVGAIAILRPALGLANGFPITFSVMVALFSVAYYSTARMALFIGAMTACLLPFTFVTEWSQRHEIDLSIVPYNFALLGSAWLTGDNLRQRRERVRELEERADTLRAEQEERERRAVAEERAHIARELHDLVSHCLGVIVVQAGAGRRLAPADGTRAASVLRLIEETGRAAMADMRRLLDVLRGSDSDLGQPAPQPRLRDLEQLVAQVRGAGLAVELDEETLEEPLPAGVELSAYRIVQEALTNSLRHSGAARAEVRIVRRDDVLEVVVSDDGKGSTGNGHRPGHGLIGMRERTELFGGSLETGPGPEGGFLVRARLPVDVVG